MVNNTLNGALMEVGETMTENLEAMGVTDANPNDGLTTKYKKQKWEFTILAPKGTRGVYISPKAGKKYAPEMEFILDRHTKLKIIDIDYVSHKVKLKVII